MLPDPQLTHSVELCLDYGEMLSACCLPLQHSARFAKWEPMPGRLQELVAACKHSGRTLSVSSSSSCSSTAEKEWELG